VTRYIDGDRIGKTARLSVGCNAILFDSTRRQILLLRRADNGWWCLPGGMMNAGESVTEACIREVWEETGLQVRIKRLTGVYSDPHRITEYDDGNRYQFITLVLEVEPVTGEINISAESTDCWYFSVDDLEEIQLLEPHREQIKHALTDQITAFIL
jgi:ADP-ribose pyrophosphatase YjhB (NUDIX family)